MLQLEHAGDRILKAWLCCNFKAYVGYFRTAILPCFAVLSGAYADRHHDHESSSIELKAVWMSKPQNPNFVMACRHFVAKLDTPSKALPTKLHDYLVQKQEPKML